MLRKCRICRKLSGQAAEDRASRGQTHTPRLRAERPRPAHPNPWRIRATAPPPGVNRPLQLQRPRVSHPRAEERPARKCTEIARDYTSDTPMASAQYKGDTTAHKLSIRITGVWKFCLRSTMPCGFATLQPNPHAYRAFPGAGPPNHTGQTHPVLSQDRMRIHRIRPKRGGLVACSWEPVALRGTSIPKKSPRRWQGLS